MKLCGVVKGQTIELDAATGLSEGQQVEVEIRTLDEPVPDMIRRADEIRQERKKSGSVYGDSLAVRMRAARDIADDIAFLDWSTPEELAAKIVAALTIEDGHVASYRSQAGFAGRVAGRSPTFLCKCRTRRL